MRLFAIEHSPSEYRADFAVYGTTWLLMAGFLALFTPRDMRGAVAALALAGLAAWTLIEYALHRFVLHGVRPFSGWHAEHHRRPTALICSPTLVSGSLIATLVFLPALAIGGQWRGGGFSVGVLTGYLAYTLTHHATHHGRTNGAWLRHRRRRHAMHHGRSTQAGHYGVTSGFWDEVFGTGSAT